MSSNEKYHSITSSTLKTKTGKDWEEWIKVLDKAKAHLLSHKGVCELLNKKYHVSQWWSQMVAVGYEQAKGIRVANQRLDGNFNVDIGKVIEIPLSELYNYVADEARRKKWLKEKIEVRKAAENKIIRANFNGLSANLSFAFYAKGESKAQIVITEAKLGSAKSVEERRAFWKKALEKLRAL